MTNRRLLCLVLLCMLALGACQSALLERGAGQTKESPSAAVFSGTEPEEVLRDFVAAWNIQDYESMHRLIASRSRELYPRPDFIARYTEAHDVINFAGLSHALNGLYYQGSTAVLDYDVVIESRSFGRIQDQGRTMRMINEGGWKIAWSQMDIFDGLSSRARLKEVTTFAERENIYDREGRELAEQGGEVVSLYVIQQNMADIEDCLDVLAKATLQQINTLRSIFTNYLPETRFHIAEMDPERYEKYREDLESICGISDVLGYSSRSYYGHGIATHVVGYIGRIPSEDVDYWKARGRDESALVGRAGIERAYEAVLGGQPARKLQIVEPGVAVLREFDGTAGKRPLPVTLTINRDMQEATAQALVDAVNAALLNWGGVALGGAIVVMDVNSGEILAMASYPSFDPHIFNPNTQYNVADRTARLLDDPRKPFDNKAIEVLYTPGSVYKIVTLLAAASEGIAPAEDPFYCDFRWYGQERYGDSSSVRYDWRMSDNKPPTGEVDMSRALAASCNPFFWEIGALMFQQDARMQSSYAEKMGFGSVSGIDGLGTEAAGNVAHPPPDQPTVAINNAIGQGDVTVTALQMAAATAMIANGGRRYQPYVVSHVGDKDSDDYQIVNKKTLLSDAGLDADSLDVVRKGMCAVTRDEALGTAWRVFSDIPYWDKGVCGKTGTAQTAGQPNAWFVAYYPKDEPKIAFAGVMANSHEGSVVVAPIIRRILDKHVRAEIDAPWPEEWREPFKPLLSQEDALAIYEYD